MDAGKPKEQHLVFDCLILSTSKSTVITECSYFVHSLIEHAGYVPEITDNLLVAWRVEFYHNCAHV